MPTSTPWGAAQSSKRFAPGIIFYSTERHGGFHLSPRRNAEVPPYMRADKGWYEEDCDAAIVACTFPQFFTPDDIHGSLDSLRNWQPDQYEQFTGTKLQPGESLKRDEALFAAAHANDYVTVTAWGSWHESVPEGMVGVCATLGGKRRFDGSERYFLVPEAEYYKGNWFQGFVIDPSRHKEVPRLS